MRERISFLFHSKQKQCFQILKTTEKLFNRFNKGFVYYFMMMMMIPKLFRKREGGDYLLKNEWHYSTQSH